MNRLYRKWGIWRRRAQDALGVFVPARISDDLVQLQYERTGVLIPVLYLTIATIVIVAAAASGGGFDIVYHVLLPAGFLGMGLYRSIVWRRRKSAPLDIAKVRRQLRSTTILAVMLGLVGGLWTMDAYYDTREARRVLAPVFIFMVTFASAICLNSLPRAAIGTIVSALTLPTIAMILAADPGIRAMGISLLIVSLLMAGLVVNNFSEIVGSLKLRYELRKLAESDALTGLANRRAFETQFAELEEAGSADEPVVLTMIDLDGFKQANDQYGHPAGDAILREVAKRLIKICTNACCIARLGGDEFAIISPSRGNLDFYAEQKEAIRAAIALPYHWEGDQIVISASLGMAVYPEDGASLSQLLKCADAALYDEKSDAQSAARIS